VLTALGVCACCRFCSGSAMLTVSSCCAFSSLLSSTYYYYNYHLRLRGVATLLVIHGVLFFFHWVQCHDCYAFSSFFVVDIVVVIIIIIFVINVIQYLDTSEPSETFMSPIVDNGIRVLFLLNLCIGHLVLSRYTSKIHAYRCFIEHCVGLLSSTSSSRYYINPLPVSKRISNGQPVLRFLSLLRFSCNFGRASLQVR